MKNYCILVSLLIYFMFPFSRLHAQIGLLDQVDRLNNTANRVMNTIERAQSLANRIDKMSTRNFDDNVTVTRGNSSNFKYDSKSIVLPKFENGEFTNFQWKPVSYFDGQLFPSTILTMYSYKKKMKGRLEAISRPLGFRLLSEYENLKINWEISCEGDKYFEKVKGTELYISPGKEQHLMPPIAWKFDVLLKQEATSPITVYFKLYDDKGHEEKRVEVLQVRSINDCIYGYLDMNLDYLFAGYIQEEHPEIEKILDEALKTKMIDAINGYQESPDATNMQVAAIWRVLHQRGFRYSSVSTTAVNNDKIESQVVRTFEKAIRSRQANCVDGTIVLASILRKIGISTIIVLTSDHCFLGYYTDPEKKDRVFLETTLLSNSDFLKTAKTPQQKNDAYFKQFELAANEGAKQYKEYNKKDDILALIDVDKTRKKVSPIPFVKDVTPTRKSGSGKASTAKPKSKTTASK